MYGFWHIEQISIATRGIHKLTFSHRESSNDSLRHHREELIAPQTLATDRHSRLPEQSAVVVVASRRPAGLAAVRIVAEAVAVAEAEAASAAEHIAAVAAATC